MIAHIVPVTRIRRDTSFWSYQIPAARQVVPGSLVAVPFAGRDVLGVVWDVEEKDDKASKSIAHVVTSVPVIRALQRRFIEYLSQTGLCSLSTALYIWMPRVLRQWPLRQIVLQQLAAFEPAANPPPQHAILVPGQRPDQENRLALKFGRQFDRLFGDRNETLEFDSWMRILSGETRVALGREAALFAPWANLRQLTLVEPEDIFFYHEQVPYLNLADAALELARTANAETDIRTYLPTPAAQLLWPGADGLDAAPASLRFTDLRTEPLISSTLVSAIKDTLALGQRVLLLYNAHDRQKTRTKEGLTASVLIPGIEGVSRQLAAALGRPALEPDIILGTRAIFDQPHSNIGLAGVISLDPLLSSERFGDQMHGIADLGHLFAYQCPMIIQSYKQDHPLMDALRRGSLERYTVDLAEEHRDLALPPFGQQVVLAYPLKEGAREAAGLVREKLAPLLTDSWQMSHPLLAPWHKRQFWHLILETPNATTRLPAAVRKAVISLPVPWRVLHNPEYLL